MWLSALAWCIAVACIGWGASVARALRAKKLPSPAELREEARQLAASDAPEQVLLEVERLLADARDEYRNRNELWTGLRRVALASGTGLSLLVLTRGVSLQQLPPALITFAAGVVGAMGVGVAGRSASSQARNARDHFAKLGRRLRVELRGTNPDAGLERPYSELDSESRADAEPAAGAGLSSGSEKP